MSLFTLRERPPALQWGVLLIASVIWVAAFELVRLPAALMLGAIAAGILLSWFEGRVKIPSWTFVIAQGFVGCLVARSITPDILTTIVRKWPMFLILIGAVVFFAAVLGFVLARLKVFPGTTAVWGSSPGAATAMVLMAEAFGGDIRLVAVMQYLRVACVGLVASIVARAFSASGGAAPAAIDWFPPVAAGPLLGTLALAVGGAVMGVKSRIPAGPLLLPLLIGAPFRRPICSRSRCRRGFWRSVTRWSAGPSASGSRARSCSTRPGNCRKIFASIFTLIAMCGGLGFALHEAAGTDPLTAYLATSPGGADAVAIIAASSPVDVPFVMAMQIGRLLIVILIGPGLARMIARWTGAAGPASSEVQASE